MIHFTWPNAGVVGHTCYKAITIISYISFLHGFLINYLHDVRFCKSLFNTSMYSNFGYFYIA